MLTQLYVRDFAVVAEADIEIGPGLTVVTGETGAGKSLLVDALLLLSGMRADAGYVRAGANRAEIQASFSLEDTPKAQHWLAAEALDADDCCRLRRVLAAGGGSKAWINGHPVSLTQLAEISTYLLEIHGQHEQQTLLSREPQQRLLDAYMRQPQRLKQVRELSQHWQELSKEIRELGSSQGRQGRLESLDYEIGELQRWALTPESYAELDARHKQLSNIGQLLEGVNRLRMQCDAEAGPRQVLNQAAHELDQLGKLDPNLLPVAELATTAGIQLDEVLASLRQYAETQDLDPAALAEADNHLSHLHTLSRRYQLHPSELNSRLESLHDEYEMLVKAGSHLAQLEQECHKLEQQYDLAAKALGEFRKQAAHQLSQTITVTMAELGMTGGQFAVRFDASSCGEPDPCGRERVEFEVSVNPGQPLRPLRKVASGGELARISLAMEIALLGLDPVACMVFDEIDSGIGGAIAEVVGHKLRQLGTTRQVLCVTHLPQVAAQGHAQLNVRKQSNGTQTSTTVLPLDTTGRIEELARMLGGLRITRETRAHAEQMLKGAQSG